MSIVGTQPDDLLHLLLKVFIQHSETKENHMEISGTFVFLLFLSYKGTRSPVGLVQDQDFNVTQLKAGCVVKMIDQPARCRY